MKWSFTWLETWDEFWSSENVGRWRELAARPHGVSSPFMAPSLARVWLEALGQEQFSPCFLWARHTSGQEVAWPLVVLESRLSHGFARRLIPVGAAVRPVLPYDALFDYQDPLVAPTAPGPCALADGFWPALRAELSTRQGAGFDLCVLQKLRGAIAEPEATLLDEGVAPFVDLDRYDDFEAYFEARSPRMRKEIRRRSRLLKARGEVEFRVHGPEDVETILSWIPALEEARLRRYAEAALPEGYLRSLVAEGLAAGLICASSLRLDGQEISWDIGLWQGGVFYAYVGSFDQRFADVAPGTLHMKELVRWLYANGATRLDFMIGQEPYKGNWTDGQEQQVRGLAIQSKAPGSTARFVLARAMRRLELATGGPRVGLRRLGHAAAVHELLELSLVFGGPQLI